MAVTHFYVDPSIAADSGAGSKADPYGDVEYCLEQNDFPAGGAQVNIKTGTDEILAAELSVAMADTAAAGKSVAWVPTETAPCIFRGYTTDENDGGIGGLSGGGSVSVFNDGLLDYVAFIDLHCHNTGANPVLLGDDYFIVIRCEIDNTTGIGIETDSFSLVTDNYVHNCGDVGVRITASGGMVARNYLANGVNSFTTAIQMLNAAGCVVENNIISIGGTSAGISLSDQAVVDGNAIYSAAGTGQGITGSSCVPAAIINNLIEGFSGVGGIGIELDGTNQGVRMYGGNSVYDCTTAYTAPALFTVDDIGGNETLGASPFTNAATGDFTPVDTGSVKEGALPNIIGGGYV